MNRPFIPFWINITFIYMNFESVSYDEVKKCPQIAHTIQNCFNMAFREKKVKVKRVTNFTLNFTNFKNFIYYDPISLDGSAWGTIRYFNTFDLDEKQCFSIILDKTKEVLRLLAITKELPESYFDECIEIVNQRLYPIKPTHQ